MIVKAVQTCVVCPSQWDVWDENGQYYYLRYRSGRGTAHAEVSPDSDQWKYDETSLVASFRHGDSLDGYLELEDFCRLAGLELSPQVEYTTW